MTTQQRNTFNFNGEETYRQLRTMEKLLDDYKGLSDEAMRMIGMWLERRNPYPQDTQWTNKTRYQQAQDFISWLNNKVEGEN